MCGIAGGFHFKGKGDFSLHPLLDLMKHRGPDESSVIEQNDWSIGVNRLAISAPNELNTQPLWSPDKRFCFVFNGEIYNHRQIRKGLLEKGYHFRTSCDSEVLFHAWLEYGTSAFLKCQGMFACAVFDTLEKRWLLARDPFGIKPLYFQNYSERFVFASEIKPLLLLQKPSINKKVLPQYLQRRFVLGKETFFSDIFRVQPAEIMEVHKSGNIKTHIYWTPKTTHFPPKNKKERFEIFSDKLQESIQLTAESEVGLATLLSGGIDSSLVNSLAHSLHKETNAWFFDNTYDRVECDFTEALTQNLEQELHKVYPEEKDFLLLPKIIRSLEEPLGDSIIIPTYKLMKHISQNERAVLSGEGADEILGGYGHHRIFYLLNKAWFPELFVGHITRWLPEFLLNKLLPYPGKFKKNTLLQALTPLNKSGIKRFIETTHLFTIEDLNKLIPDFLKDRNLSESLYPDVSSLKDLMYFDIQNWLPNYNLLRIDKLSMAHSLEVRVPYLNVDFANFTFHLPEKDIISFFIGKKILRKFAYKKSYLDLKTSYRKKHPFTFKEMNLYGKKYREFIQDHLDESFRKTWQINPKMLNNLLKDNEDTLSQKQLTSLLHLSIWTKEFF